jgi:metallo-beta-lactamase family protein
MQIQFFGAVREVTGSSHLLTVNGKRILLDCGLFQGKREESVKKNNNLKCRPSNIDTVVVSHAHIDHTGNLPSLVKQGFRGQIICTHATKDLIKPMLQDSAHIQEQDFKYMKKHGIRYAGAREPLYTQEDVNETLQLIYGVHYQEKTKIDENITLIYHDAGHILGSAIVELQINDGGEQKKLIFSGDLGRAGLPIIRDPEMIDEADVLIMESTYGNREHEPVERMGPQLAEAINGALGSGGKILIPSFALERTQEIVYHLNDLINNNVIPEIPIYVDSPLATTLTEVFREHTECYDEEIKKTFLENLENPFGLGRVTYTRSVDESKKLNHLKGPMIIIAGSGMAENGRIRHHLLNNIEDPHTCVIIVGFQAEYTLGRKLVEGASNVKIFGHDLQVRAEIKVLNAFSAHGDMHDLDNFAEHIQGLKKIFLVHGEIDQQDALANRLKQKTEAEVIIPQECGEIHET